MSRLKKIVLAVCFILYGVGVAQAWPWDDKGLVTLNGHEYTEDAFRHWWDSWQEKDTPLPETLDSFIDWHLLAGEAQSMELQTLPELQHKVQTFLKVRALMLLKQEEVDSKIRVDDQVLWEQYALECCPRYLVEFFGFDDKADAVKVSAGLNSGAMAVEELRERPEAKNGRHFFGKKWLRATSLDQAWQDSLTDLEVGTASLPLAAMKGWAVLYLLEIKGPDQDDFEKRKGRYLRDVKKKEQRRLTGELIDRLREKHKVRVEQELYDKLDLAAIPDEWLEKTLIHLSSGTITVREFMAPFLREQKVVGRNLDSPEKRKKQKEITLANILAQTLTTREALERHYEEKEPFKWSYQFYIQNRLIVALEQRLFEGRLKPSEEEIVDYYNKNTSEFSHSGQVTFKRIAADERLVNKMWEELSVGQDFLEVAGRYYRHPIASQTMPFDRLGPELRKALQNLAKGEVGRPFTTQGHYNLVQLVDRQASLLIPLKEVRGEIEKRLRVEKRDRLRAAYLAELKTKSVISTNQKRWEILKSELGSAND